MQGRELQIVCKGTRRAIENYRGDTLSNPYGKTAYFSTKSKFSPIRTEIWPFSVPIPDFSGIEFIRINPTNT